MATVNDEKFRALRAAGHTGSISDMWLQFLVAKTPGVKTISDGQYEWMQTSLGVAATGQWNTDWYAYLGTQGFTQGSLNDRELAFWSAQ